MMNTLYLDIFSGISGDMFLGALLDLGVDLSRLESELQKLGVTGYHLHSHRAQRAHLDGIRFEVHLDAGSEHTHVHAHADGTTHTHAHRHRSAPSDHDHPHPHGHADQTAHPATPSAETTPRTFASIRDLISRSPLSPWVREKAIAVFARIAAAEARVHGLPADEVHFHEVGALDSIVDIVGACLALEILGKPRVQAGPVVEGTGWVQCAHGRYPLPVPATLAILGARGIAITQCEEPHELVTPTGAALLAEFAETSGPMHGLIARRIGLGLGSRETVTRPNVLRAILGESADPSAAGPHDWESDTVATLQTNLDDINAEWLGHFVKRALALGALDVFHTPIQMKKSRPGVLLTVLCPTAAADRFTELILRETTAFGVRRWDTERRKLRREFTEVVTPFGRVTVKIGRLNGQVVQTAPEYESCRQVAEQAGVPLKQVYDAAMKATP